jgi:hypothetical protein
MKRKQAKQPKPANDRTLRTRLNRFLSSRVRGGPEVGRLLEYLKPAGEVILFGGVLRDLALEGGHVYPTDIDIVVRTMDEAKFKALIEPMSAKRNRFGGYRFAFARWNFDVWSFSDTWAFRVGLISGHSVHDLLKTTFFDWDAIAYVANSGRLIFDEPYFDRISRRVVDINLMENPNPLGAAIRALRIFKSGRGQLTPRLAKYTIEMVQKMSNDSDNLDTPPRSAEINAWIQATSDQVAARLHESGELPVSGEAHQIRIPA